MSSEKSSAKTQIIIAIIGLIGVITAAIIGNSDKLFPTDDEVNGRDTIQIVDKDTTNVGVGGIKKTKKCNEPWEWDNVLKTCVQKITIPPKTFSIPLSDKIAKLNGNIFFYTNRERLPDQNGMADYRDNPGALQVHIPIMLEKTMVGSIREVIYKASEGKICKVMSLPETTGHLKKMKVAYSLFLITDCNNPRNPCSARIVQSGTRVQITTTELTVLIGNDCSK